MCVCILTYRVKQGKIIARFAHMRQRFVVELNFDIRQKKLQKGHMNFPKQQGILKGVLENILYQLKELKAKEVRLKR